MKMSEEQLRSLTDYRSWNRGVGYYEDGNVISMKEKGNTIQAKVAGTRNYRVDLWYQDGELDGTCSCPMGDSGVFCKHCVAVGLTYLDKGTDSISKKTSKQKQNSPGKTITTDDIRKFLKKKNADSLVDIIMDSLTQDDTLRGQLILEIARSNHKGVNIYAFKETIDDATEIDGFIDYRNVYDFYEGIANVLSAIEDTLNEGHAKEVIEISEYALKCVEKATHLVDDSDGYMGELFDSIQSIHLQACLAAKPDPQELAKRLFNWELNSDWSTFSGAAQTYAKILGKNGLTVYRKHATAEWKKLPKLKPGTRSDRFESNRFRITSIMESLANASGDIEELVKIKSKDLSSTYHFFDIARIYKEANQPDKALEWAEKGRKAFLPETDSRLETFLANEYHDRNFHDKAMKLIWQVFVEQTNLDSYKLLKEHASKSKQWEKWQKQALEHIRNNIKEAKKSSRSGYRHFQRWSSNSLLVEIFLWEKDDQAAWQEAKIGDCDPHIWMRLAKIREKDHPADAAEVYKRLVGPIVDRTNNKAYREAVTLIKKIKLLMDKIGMEKEFQQYTTSLKSEYKRKRNFMAMLNRLKL